MITMKTWWDRKNIVINENIIVKEIAIQRTDCIEYGQFFVKTQNFFVDIGGILVWRLFDEYDSFDLV
jgi:hypothetical protein